MKNFKFLHLISSDVVLYCTPANHYRGHSLDLIIIRNCSIGTFEYPALWLFLLTCLITPTIISHDFCSLTILLSISWPSPLFPYLLIQDCLPLYSMNYYYFNNSLYIICASYQYIPFVYYSSLFRCSTDTSNSTCLKLRYFLPLPILPPMLVNVTTIPPNILAGHKSLLFFSLPTITRA